jgi:hypothetical protein
LVTDQEAFCVCTYYIWKQKGTGTINHHREKDTVVLSPCSTNAAHKELRFYQGDELKVQGVMVQVLESEHK